MFCLELIRKVAETYMRLNAGSLRLEKAEALKRYEIENRTAVCRTARTVVWEGGENPPYPIFVSVHFILVLRVKLSSRLLSDVGMKVYRSGVNMFRRLCGFRIENHRSRGVLYMPCVLLFDAFFQCEQ